MCINNIKHYYIYNLDIFINIIRYFINIIVYIIHIHFKNLSSYKIQNYIFIENYLKFMPKYLRNFGKKVKKSFIFIIAVWKALPVVSEVPFL